MTFLEILIPPNSLPDGRQGLEDDINDALEDVGLGEVTGGGSGIKGSNIDVEVADVEIALPIIRRILQHEPVPPETLIRQAEPKLAVYKVYE